jgi:hypothetical protein
MCFFSPYLVNFVNQTAKAAIAVFLGANGKCENSRFKKENKTPKNCALNIFVLLKLIPLHSLCSPAVHELQKKGWAS